MDCVSSAFVLEGILIRIILFYLPFLILYILTKILPPWEGSGNSWNKKFLIIN